MLRNRVMMVVGLLVLASMILAACAPKATPTPAPVVTTEPGMPEPMGRTGAWVDEIVFTEIPDPTLGVAQLDANEIDVYSFTISGNPALLRTVQENPGLKVVYSFGGWRELAFNTAVFTDTTKLNPFANPKIREAMNYVVDRNYIATELQGGTVVPKLMPMNSSFADYARYADLARALEAKYAYDFDKGKAIVDAEMLAAGATLNADGKWEFGGQPVVLVALIRTEWALSWGNYYADQLELMGFTVDRQAKNVTDAAAVWRGTKPADGQWNVYTSGWGSTAISRDDGGNWAFLQTPIYLPYGYVQAYTPSAEFYDVAEKLWNNDFTTMEERRGLFEQAMVLGLEDSSRVQLFDEASFTPMRANVEVAYDLAGGVTAAGLTAYTIRFADQEGGTMRVAMPSVLTEPWNPIGGSNFTYDRAVARMTESTGVLSNPYTGLGLPNRIAGAEVVATEGLPIAKTLDWIDLRFEPTIEVPTDVWVDWDAAEGRFITAAEKWPEGTTSLIKTTVYYPEDLWNLTYHDGSHLSPADFVMGMILTFDRAKPESPYYDDSAVANLEATLETFKGVRIISTDPLVIETYNDTYGLDAENSVSTWWPSYGYGEGSWHVLSVALKAEAEGELALSSDKATSLEVEHMSFIDGPSLPILKAKLDEAAAENFLPYPFLSQYLGADEMVTRYTNLQNWYATYGHFWVGSGPFYLDKVYSTENIISIKRNEAFPDPATKWGNFGNPKLPVVDVVAPAQVKIGQAATFDVSVTYEGAAYPANEIATAAYILYGASGEMVAKGDATLVSDGKYQVVLNEATTALLASGSAKIEVVVVSLLVSIPQFNTVEFIVAP